MCCTLQSCTTNPLAGQQLTMGSTRYLLLSMLLCLFCAVAFRMACRCVWDSETDSYAFESFKNVSFCCCFTAKQQTWW
jgi:hypothetical protein